jgi:hypothetical protein
MEDDHPITRTEDGQIFVPIKNATTVGSQASALQFITPNDAREFAQGILDFLSALEADKMHIIINGTRIEFYEASITYEQVIDLAGQPNGASVMYVGPRHGDSQRSGIMHEGKVVRVEDGMKFDAVHTGNA